MRQLYIFIILMIIMSGLATALTNGLSSCTLTGNHYECTGAINADEFNAGQYSIHFSNAVVSFSGATGGSSSPGTAALLSITSNNRILIEGSSFTVTGGAGGNGNTAPGVTGDGGAGATGTIYINASFIEVYNSTLSSTGGAGGAGDSSVCASCGCDEEAAGGAGGTAYIYFGDSQSTIKTNNLTTTIRGGNGAAAQADSCVTTTGTSVRIQCASASGGSSGNAYQYFYYNIFNMTNSKFNGIGGNAGLNDASACQTYTGGSSTTASNSGGEYGSPIGTSNTYFIGNQMYINGLYTTFTGGIGVNGRAIAGVVSTSGAAVGDCRFAAGSGVLGDIIFSIDSNYIYANNITTSYTGSSVNGYSYDYSSDSYGSASYSCSANGRAGQGVTLYILSNNSNSKVINSNLIASGGAGGEGQCTRYTSGSGNDCGWAQGYGGDINYYSRNINYESTNFSFTGGTGFGVYANCDGSGSDSCPKSGDGGVTDIISYDIATFDSNSLIDLNGGTGGLNGCSSSKVNCAPGAGGESIIYNYGTLNISSTLDFDAGAAGSATACYYCGGITCEGGDASITGNGSLYLNNGRLNLTGGAGPSCAEGGDVEINTYNEFISKNNTNIYGIAGSSAGDCQNTFYGKVQLFNTTYNCTASTGDSNWTGYNVTQFDLRSNSYVRMSALYPKNISLYYTGNPQRYLIQNSSFDKTNIFWNNASCKFANLTPYSIGTVVFNESCPSISFDAYYTFINSLTQSYTYSNISKPLPYSYTNYSCIINADIPSDATNIIYAELKWYKNGILNSTESNIPLTSRTNYTSINKILGGNISDNITCTANITSGISYNGLCYQESANITNQKNTDGNCGLKYTGKYISSPNYLYVNYTKPNNVLSNNNYWNIKYGGFNPQNLSIPIDCFNLTDIQLRTYVESSQPPNFGMSYPQCFNGTSWKTIGNNSNYTGGFICGIAASSDRWYDGDWSTGNSYGFGTFLSGADASSCIEGTLYEEAMYWNISTNASFISNSSISSTIVPSYPYNLKIDVGNDGVLDYNSTGVYNNTLAQIFLKSGINTYLRDCVTDNCSVPIRFYNDEDTKFIINQVNSSYGVSNPSNNRFNMSLALFSADAGIINIDSLLMRYVVSNRFPITMRTTNGSNITYYVTVETSNYTQGLPKGVVDFEMRPPTITSKNVQPYGQTNLIGIFNLTNNHPTKGVDIYMRLNHSWSSMNFDCTNLVLRDAPLTGIANNTFNITTTSQKILTNISATKSKQIWAYESFNCTWAQVQKSIYQPEFVFDALCDDCVVGNGAFN